MKANGGGNSEGTEKKSRNPKRIYLRGKSYYYDFFYEGKRYAGSLGQVNKTIAGEKLEIIRADVIRGTYKPKIIQVSLANFCEQYLQYSKQQKRENSFKRDENSIKRLKKGFGDIRISEILPFAIEKYKKKRREQGAEVGTINRELACLRNMLNLAIGWGKLKENPFKTGPVKLFKEPKGKPRAMSDEEEKRLMEAIDQSKNPFLRAIVITALQTGMRKGEIINLKWSNVDLLNRVINVEGTKSGENRSIPMNTTLTQVFEGVKNISKGEFVFSSNGYPFRDVKEAWWAALEKAKIENFRFHDLRHTFGTRLGMAGVDLPTIQKLMGHKTIEMTLRYSHPAPDHMKRAVEKLSQVPSIFSTGGELEKRENAVSI